jgi:beta-glucanase (GH16 family)
MLVKNLIEALNYQDPEAEVHFAYGYGDHWRTTVAPAVSNVKEGVVEYSDYHRMDKLVEEGEIKWHDDEEEYVEEEEVRKVVIIG